MYDYLFHPTLYIKIFFFSIIQHVKARAIPCPHQPPTRGDNTVLVAQGGTANPGAAKQLLPPDRVLRELYIYIYIYIYTHTHIYIYIHTHARSINSRDYIGRYFRRLMLLRVYSNRFLRNHMGKVVPCLFPSCWKLLAFNQIQLDAYCVVVWRRFEAIFKLRPVIPIFERN